MASIKHFLAMVFSSLLVAGGYSFPSLRLLFQDGGAGDNLKARSLPAESPLGAAGRWEWETTGEASHESPPLPRRKRGVASPSESPLEAITLLEDETTHFLEDFTTEPLEEDETSQTGLARSGASTEVTTTSSSLNNTSTEAAVVHLARNGASTDVTTTSSSLNDTSTEAAVVHLNTVRYKAQFHGQMTTTVLSEDFTETEGAKDGSRPSHTIDTARPTSTAPSPSLVASKSSVKTAGSTTSSLFSVLTASYRPSSAVQTRPPSTAAPQGPDRMVSQCLLAISLLALVAAIFIITAFVLMALLLRQKRLYKLRQGNHTEMVCISSLLAAEEAEASGGRAHRDKRAKLLAENGSETDMDNLTLNSFLPDH